MLGQRERVPNTISYARVNLTRRITTHGFKNHTVRTEGWRNIRYANGDEELYDEAADPLEYTNLASAATSRTQGGTRGGCRRPTRPTCRAASSRQEGGIAIDGTATTPPAKSPNDGPTGRPAMRRRCRGRTPSRPVPHFRTGPVPNASGNRKNTGEFYMLMNIALLCGQPLGPRRDPHARTSCSRSPTTGGGMRGRTGPGGSARRASAASRARACCSTTPTPNG